MKCYLKQGLPEEDALHADNITSFWTVYKRLLELEAGWLAYKTEKSLHSLLRQIRSKGENDFTKKIIAVNEELDKGETITCVVTGHLLKDPNTAIDACTQPTQVDADIDTLRKILMNK